MIFYITVLRALAAILITNSHYTGVYPVDIIASGGVLGDVIFFAISGFCLYNIKDNFINWYKKRIIRIYPGLWIITLLYLIIGCYTLESMNIFQYFIYPTYYHFIASIVFLYIIYYIIIKNDALRKNIPKIMVALAIIQFIIYFSIYNKEYYHIDVVREPMIRFLFLQAMLLGAYFRENHQKYVNKNKVINWIIMLIFFTLYFISKVVFSKNIFVEYQIMNQIIIFIFLYFIFKSFSGIDHKLEKLPVKLKNVISFIAKITLEIYLVQYPIISIFKNIVFPMNWIIITGSIIISAYLLHIIVNAIIKKLN